MAAPYTGITVKASWTPAAAAYGAGDVMGTTPIQQFLLPAGGAYMAAGTVFEIDTTALQSGEGSYGVALYSATPPSAYADNAAWDLPAGDRLVYLGTIPLAAPVDLGTTLIGQQANVNQSITVPFETNAIYAYLITNAAFTATAVARIVTLQLIQP